MRIATFTDALILVGVRIATAFASSLEASVVRS